MSPSPMGIYSCLQILTVLSAIGAASAACYYPNGTDRNAGFPSDTYFPVNEGDDVSMCCSHLGDKPRSDGLCANSDGSVIWRESCTDITWQSPKCIKLCAGEAPDTNGAPSVGRQMDNDEQVTPCADGSYCCGDQSLGISCCNEGRGVFIRDGTTQRENPTATSTSSATSTTAQAVTQTTDSAAILSNSTDDTPNPTPPKSRVNAGAIAGGVVGGLAGLLIIIFAVWFLFFRRRKAKKAQSQEHPPLSEIKPQMYGDYKSPEPREVQGTDLGEYKRSELQAGTVSKTMGRAELDALQPSTPHEAPKKQDDR